MQQGHGLAHHVRSHQCAVGIVVLEERNQSCGNRRNLLRCYVHEVYLCGRNNGEVGILAAFHHFADKRTVVVQRGITLTDDVVFLFFSCQINHVLVLQVYNAILHLTVRSLDEAKLIDLSVYAERRNQTDVRSFRALDRTQTAVVGVVYVTHLETGTLTRQTTRTQSRQTALVSHLGKRVGLVHELAQRVGSEE